MVTASNCEICRKGLRTVTIDDKKWLACRNAFCEQYGIPIERSPEPATAHKAGRSAKRVGRGRQGS